MGPLLDLDDGRSLVECVEYPLGEVQYALVYATIMAVAAQSVPLVK